MYKLTAYSPDDGLAKAIQLIESEGYSETSRNGPVLSLPAPVIIHYPNPTMKVSLMEERDANPFFHIFEALWILAGRDDVKFLTEFNQQMGAYSDDGQTFNAAYGYRLRKEFTDEGNCDLDQIASVIEILRKDPQSRQAVCQIWSAKDLEKSTKDKACNMMAVFRVVQGKLDLTIYNRSNDVIWGAFGANVVQFSTLLEYVAAHTGYPVGNYYQISNNLHIYTTGKQGEQFQKIKAAVETDYYEWERIVTEGDTTKVSMVDEPYAEDICIDIDYFFQEYDKYGMGTDLLGCVAKYSRSNYFRTVVIPVLNCWVQHRVLKETSNAISSASNIQDDYWRLACKLWLTRRFLKQMEKKNGKR